MLSDHINIPSDQLINTFKEFIKSELTEFVFTAINEMDKVETPSFLNDTKINVIKLVFQKKVAYLEMSFPDDKLIRMLGFDPETEFDEDDIYLDYSDYFQKYDSIFQKYLKITSLEFYTSVILNLENETKENELKLKLDSFIEKEFENVLYASVSKIKSTLNKEYQNYKVLAGKNDIKFLSNENEYNAYIHEAVYEILDKFMPPNKNIENLFKLLGDNEDSQD